MSIPPPDLYKTPHEPSQSINWWLIWLGMIVFGIGNFFYFFAAAESMGNATGGLLLVGITLVVSAVMFAIHRSLALGIVSGYVAMTLVSGGECTWAYSDAFASGNGAFAALLLYPLVLVIVLVVAIVASVRESRRARS